MFQDQYETAESLASENQFFQNTQIAAKPEEERHKIFEVEALQRIRSYQSHASDFRNKYIAQAKYLRDLLMDRLPPKTSDMLINNNGQAEATFSSGMLNGAFNEYIIANYLDELANAACPLTDEQKKAKDALYRTIAARLSQFESQGKQFHDRCMPTSKNPPTPAEVNEWRNKANAYVRSTTLEEHLKTEFEYVDAERANAIYAGEAAGCESLAGKIIDKNSELSVLGHYLTVR